MQTPPAASRSPVPPASRPEVCGPHAPERPYPIYLRGEVEKGFGRGSKELGCPTANLPARVVGPGSKLNRTGVYFGFARVLPQEEEDVLLTDSDADEPSTSAACPGNGSTALEEDEDNEVVLGASPIQDGAEGFLQSGGPARARHGSKSSVLRQSVTRDDLATDGQRLDKEDQVAAQEQRDADASALAAADRDGEAILRGQGSPTSRHRGVASSSSTGSGRGFSSIGRKQKKKRIPLAPQDSRVFPMVMSVGWNPFYKNTAKTAEVHILHDFAGDFYGLEVRVVVLGYVRPEYNYDSLDALVADIEMDKKVTVNSLNRPLYQDYAEDPFLGKHTS